MHFAKGNVKPSGKTITKDSQAVDLIRDLKSDYEKINDKATDMGK